MLRIIFLLSFTICLNSLLAQQLHHANESLPCVNKNYNLLAHIAVDSTDRVPLYTMEELEIVINKLNHFFSPICISFSLCEYHILEDDYSLGRVVHQPITSEEQLSELKTRFSLRRRINVFFLDFIENEDCGTSTFESILTEIDANIFIEKDCIDDEIATQLAHHLGHTFGLSDTYDSSTIEFVNGANCNTTGDFLCDTPADPYGQSVSNATAEELELIAKDSLVTSFYDSSCEFIYEIKDPNGQYYQPDMGNIMSAYPCKCGFTQDQYRLMVETILKSTMKHF